MPITQTTVLGLYGELRDLIDLIEQATRDAEAEQNVNNWRGVALSRMARLHTLRAHAASIERKAIQLLMTDEPSIHINPLDGSML